MYLRKSLKIYRKNFRPPPSEKNLVRVPTFFEKKTPMGTTLFTILGLLPRGSTTYVLCGILGWVPPPRKAPTLKIGHTCRFGTTLPPPPGA